MANETLFASRLARRCRRPTRNAEGGAAYTTFHAPAETQLESVLGLASGVGSGVRRDPARRDRVFDHVIDSKALAWSAAVARCAHPGR